MAFLAALHTRLWPCCSVPGSSAEPKATEFPPPPPAPHAARPGRASTPSSVAPPVSTERRLICPLSGLRDVWLTISLLGKWVVRCLGSGVGVLSRHFSQSSWRTSKSKWQPSTLGRPAIGGYRPA